MRSGEIRAKFLEFFKSKGHKIVPSDSLVPKADPTLLFTSAGMNQFKEQFLGHNVTYKRAASCQKCLRTADLDKVGKTPSHHTFFEMLGNFSFGDYFKKEAIGWSWEFMTEVLRIEKEKLWVSVYKNDREAYDIWRNFIKVPEKRIVKLGAKENFWPSNAPEEGPNGPCGPCSEIFYDWGESAGSGKKGCDPSCGSGRFIEVWNLVFTQYDRIADGKLADLPSKNIDTGMGLERITAVMQAVKTNFETDLFMPIIEAIKANCELRTANRGMPNADSLDAVRSSQFAVRANINAIADHVRAATFAIADGVAPSNEERGYVIRKLIRKAYLYGGGRKPFLYNVVPKIAEIMKDAYPELTAKREEISLIVKEEEEKFGHTLETAMPILEENIKRAKNNELDGKTIFKLVDTYGLPLEVIEGATDKKKIRLDIDTFERLMNERKELSRKKSKIEEDIFAISLFKKAPKVPSSSDMPLEGKIAFMVKEKKAVKMISDGDVAEVLVDPQSSLFYAEAGGQVGDTGAISSAKGSGDILNTMRIGENITHIVKVVKGAFSGGDIVRIELDKERKSRIAKNHTATHLLQSALRRVLGEHVHQAGSLVADDRLRFDFTHMKKLTDRELEMVEEIVNESIRKKIAVTRRENNLEEAQEEGAIALFGEKYRERVTVVTAGDISKEVCGGTHVDNTEDIGLFKIMRESAVASGIRRIEAVTSDKAREYIAQSAQRIAQSAKLEKEKEEEKKLEKERIKKISSDIGALIGKASDVKGVKVIAEKIDGADMGILRAICDRIKAKENDALIVLFGAKDGKAFIVSSVTENLVKRGVDASKMVKDIAKLIEGRGGGRPDFAQAGGKNVGKIPEAIDYAKKAARDLISEVF